MNVEKRGTELVIAELASNLRDEHHRQAETYAGTGTNNANKVDDFGLVRLVQQLDRMKQLHRQYEDIVTTYIAAERMRGRK